MAPESQNPSNPSSTPNQTAARVPSGQTVAVPRPAAGEASTVNSSPAGNLNLGFDPAEATAARSGNSLVFTLNDGSSVTIDNFFVVGNEALPNLTLPDGTTVASADFFSGSGLDMTTAAGPGAGAGGAGSGSGDYRDDAGSLIDGVGKSGSLGTDYWARGTEVPETQEGLLVAEAGAPISIIIYPENPEFPGGPDPERPDDPLAPGMNMTGDRLRMAENVLHDGTAHQHADGEAGPSGQVQLRIVTNDGLVALVIDGARYDLIADPADPNHFTLNIPDTKDDSGVGHLSGGEVYLDADGSYVVIIDYTLDTNYLGHNEQGVESDEVGSFDFSAIGNSGVESAPAVIHIDIIDDVPVARADTADLGSEAASIAGNVLDGTVNGVAVDGADDAFGADHAAATPLEWVNAEGAPAMSVTLDGGEKIALSWNAGTHVLTGDDGKNYGTLELNPDGTYTYTKPGPENFAGKIVVVYTIEDGDGDKSSSTLTLNVTDKGIIIDPPTDPDPVNPSINSRDILAHESWLEAGGNETHDGSDPAHDQKDWTEAKTLTFTAEDGFASLVIGGKTLTADGQTETVQGKYGQMEVTLHLDADGTGGTLTYKYLLEQRVEHANADGTNLAIVDPKGDESFSMTITDKDGDQGQASINVLIQDDVPILTVGTNPGTASPGGTATGTLALVEGADGADWTTFTVNGKPAPEGFGPGKTGTFSTDEYGNVTVTVSDDGKTITYKYDVSKTTADDASFTLKFQVEDNDGDPTEATVTFTVKDNPVTIDPAAPGMGGRDLEVFENLLEADAATDTHNGSSVDGEDSWTGAKSLTFQTPDGFGGLTVNDEPILPGQTVTVRGEHGQMSVTLSIATDGKTGTLTYKYLLEERVEHVDAQDANKNLAAGETAEAFKVVVTDSDGDQADATINVSIVDDVPTMSLGGLPGVITAGNTATGTLALVEGADGADWTTFTVNGKAAPEGFGPGKSGTFNTSEYGNVTVTVSADGKTITYSYDVPKNGYKDTYNLTFKVKDHDGDPTEATASFTAKDNPVNILPNADGFGFTTNENVLEAHGAATHDGSSVNGVPDWTDSKTMNFQTEDGFSKLEIGGKTFTANGQTEIIQGEYGRLEVTLTLAADGKTGSLTYRYLLEDRAEHVSGNDTNSALAAGETPEEFTVTVHDSNGDAANAKIAVTIVDDVPQAFTPDAAKLANDNGFAGGDLNAIWGADGPDAIMGAIFKPTAVDKLSSSGGYDFYKTNLTSDGDAVVYRIDPTDPSKLEAGTNENGLWKPVFTATLDAEHNSYSIEMQGHLDLAFKTDFIQADGGAQGGMKGIAFLNTMKMLYGEPDIPESWVAKISARDANGNLADINGNANVFGVGDKNAFNDGESLKFEFHRTAAGQPIDLSSGYTKPQTGTTFMISNVKGAVAGTYTLLGVDGNPYTGTFTAVGNKIVIDGNGYDSGGVLRSGIVYTELTLTITSGECKIGGFEVTTRKHELNTDLTLPVQITDADGDAASSSLGVTITPAGTGGLGEHVEMAAGTYAGTAGDDMVYGTSGHDQIAGGAGNDSLYGGDGNDTIVGGGGNDVIYGDAGHDLIVGGDAHYGNLHGDTALAALKAAVADGSLAQHMGLIGQGTAADGNNELHGGAGNDVIIGGGGNDTIYGGAGNDLIHGGGGNDLINGGEGHDTIFGGAGNDIIYGGAGDDLIYGGAGNDVLYGGTGSDTFAWASGDMGGTDVVKDFTLHEDRLSFADLFGNAPQESLSLSNVLGAVQEGRIDVTASAADQLTVTVGEQTVQITLSGQHLTDTQLQALNSSHTDNSSAEDAEKAALLQQMLTNIGG